MVEFLFSKLGKVRRDFRGCAQEDEYIFLEFVVEDL